MFLRLLFIYIILFPPPENHQATNDLDGGQDVANEYYHADAAQGVPGTEIHVEHTNIPDTFTDDGSRYEAESSTSEQHSSVINDAKDKTTNDLDERQDVANEYNHDDPAHGAPGNEIVVKHTNILDAFADDVFRCGAESFTSEQHFSVNNKATNDLDERQDVANEYNHVDASHGAPGNETDVERTNITDTFTNDKSRCRVESVTSEQHSSVNNEDKNEAANDLDEIQDVANEYNHVDAAHGTPGNETDVGCTTIPDTFTDDESRCGAESVTSELHSSVNKEAKNKATNDLDDGQDVAIEYNHADAPHGAPGNEIDVEHRNIPTTFTDDESRCWAESVTSAQQSSMNNGAKNKVSENEKVKYDIAKKNVIAQDRESNHEYETSSVPDMKDTDICESDKNRPQCAACCCWDSNYIFTLETETGSGTVHITNANNKESEDSDEEYNDFENSNSPNNTDICEREEQNCEYALCCCNASEQFLSLETESASRMVNIRNDASKDPVNEEESNYLCKNFPVRITFDIIDIDETDEEGMSNFCPVADSEQNYTTDAENIGTSSVEYRNLWEDFSEETAYDTETDETEEECMPIFRHFFSFMENRIMESENIGNNSENIFSQNVFREMLQTAHHFNNADNSENAVADNNERSNLCGSPHTDIQDHDENLNEIVERMLLFSYSIQFLVMLINSYYWRKG